MSFGLYMVGFAVMVIGLILGAYYMHIPPHWIAAGALVVVGIGIAGGVAKTRTKDPS